MDNEMQAAKASLEEIKRSALEHYDEVSSKAHHWNSFIPQAIKAYREWVSAEERLPDDGEKILFYTTGFSNNDIRLGTFVKKDAWGRENIFIGDGYFATKKVSHWMPLPEPPQSTTDK